MAEPREKSAARDKLYELVCDGTIPPATEMKPKMVYETFCKPLPEFASVAYDGFATRLRSARQRASKQKGRATIDNDAFQHDRQMFPAQLFDCHGEPKWAGSAAQKLLRVDIKNGKNKTTNPRLLYKTQEECYQNYSLDTFRDRIYEEVKALKRKECMKTKAEKKAEKQLADTEKRKQKQLEATRKDQEQIQKEVEKQSANANRKQPARNNKKKQCYAVVVVDSNYIACSVNH